MNHRILLPSCSLFFASAISLHAVAQTQSMDQLRIHGAFGFPAGSARVHCDTENLRVQSWNDQQTLVVQAILWKDGDNGLGETNDGREIGDNSNLVLDLDLDHKRTPQVDRTYALDPWPSRPGLRYTIPFSRASSSHLMGDSTGRGSIRYVAVSGDRKVRVDTYVIPLSELDLEPGKTIGIAFMASSTVPEFVVNSIDYVSQRKKYYSFMLPYQDFDRMTLAPSTDKVDLTKIPAGREDEQKIDKPPAKPIPEIGTIPPQFAAGDWLNTQTPPTLKSLKGKVVLIDFWATWCGPCVAGIPHLNGLYEANKKDGLRILSFTDQSRKGIENFQKHTEIKYPVGVASELALEYGVTGLPHAFLIGRNGKLLWEGNPSDESVDERIAAALQATDRAD